MLGGPRPGRAAGPSGRHPRRPRGRWEAEAHAIRGFVDTQCWSEAKTTYVRFAGGEELDGSLLLGILFGYLDPGALRAQGTIDSLRRELRQGPFLYRYSGEDGLPGGEGVFVTCSFWLVEALARAGRVDEAAQTMDQLVVAPNDVGLHAEELDPATGDFPGNFPQALTHLALINAATAVTEETAR